MHVYHWSSNSSRWKLNFGYSNLPMDFNVRKSQVLDGVTVLSSFFSFFLTQD